MTGDDYLAVIWTATGEFPGYIAAVLLIDRIGRKKSMAVLALISVISTFSLAKCGAMSTSLIAVLLFCSRGSIAGWYQVLFVYTPEVYTTTLRAVALGEITYYIEA